MSGQIAVPLLSTELLPFSGDLRICGLVSPVPSSDDVFSHSELILSPMCLGLGKGNEEGSLSAVDSARERLAVPSSSQGSVDPALGALEIDESTR